MSSVRTPTPPTTNPYIGPRSFLPNERLYGRSRELRDLTGLLIAERIVLMHSPSGAGKTSLIQAALIPALERRSFQVEPIIRVNTLLPADAPAAANPYVVSALLALSARDGSAGDLSDGLLSHSLRSYLDARDAAEGDEHLDRLLIFDQFEEILTVDPLNHAAKTAFFVQLGEALGDRDKRRWALFAMREDYLANLTPYLHLVPTRFKTTFRLDLLDPLGAQQAIQGPVQAAGHTFSDAAAEALVNDLRRTQVQHPDDTISEELGLGIEPVQLQVVCYRLWQRIAAAQPVSAEPMPIHVQPADVTGVRNVDRSLEEYYAEGVARAVAETGVPERDIREWFERKLITPLGIRGQVLRGATQSDGLPNRALTPLINAYLVRAEQRRGLTWYELAHDRLIAPVRVDNQHWFAQYLSPLQLQADRWQQSGQAPSLLFRDADLAAAEAWATAHTDELRPVEHDFLAACAALRAEVERDRRTAQRIRRLAVISTITAVLAIVGLVGALLAYGRATAAEAEARSQEQLALAAKEEALAQERIAAAQRNKAVARSYAAYALTQLEANPERALILAREAARVPGPDGQPLPEALEVLWRVQSESRIRRAVTYTDERYAVAYSPDGTLLASAGAGGTVDLIDTATGATRTFATPDAVIARIAFSGDGTRLAAAAPVAGVFVWDVASAELVTNVTPEGFVFDIAFGPTGVTLAVASGSFDEGFIGGATIFDLSDGAALLEVPHAQGANSVALSADGTLLVSGGLDRIVLITEVATGATIATFEQPDTVISVAANADGSQVALVERVANSGTLWTLTGDTLDRLEGHTAPINDLALSSDGRFAATSSEDRTVRVYRTDSAQTVVTLRGFDAPIWQLAFHPDGTRVAVASSDGRISEWDVTGAFGVELTYGEFDPTGRFLAVGDSVGTVWIVDATTGALVQVLRANTSRIYGLNFNADGNLLAVASEDGVVTIWDVATWQSRTLFESPVVIWGVRFHPDGQRLFVAAGGALQVWDLARGAEVATYPFDANLLGMDVSPDGTLFAVSPENSNLLIGAADTGTVTAFADETPYNGPVAFSPDGRLLAARDLDGDIIVFTIAQFTEERFEGAVFTIDQTDGFSFAADSNRLVIARRDNTVALVDLTTEQAILQVPEAAASRWALLIPDQTRLISIGSDGMLRAYPLQGADLLLHVDGRITRPPTPEECSRFALPEGSGCAIP